MGKPFGPGGNDETGDIFSNSKIKVSRLDLLEASCIKTFF